MAGYWICQWYLMNVNLWLTGSSQHKTQLLASTYASTVKQHGWFAPYARFWFADFFRWAKIISDHSNAWYSTSDSVWLSPPEWQVKRDSTQNEQESQRELLNVRALECIKYWRWSRWWHLEICRRSEHITGRSIAMHCHQSRIRSISRRNWFE